MRRSMPIGRLRRLLRRYRPNRRYRRNLRYRPSRRTVIIIRNRRWVLPPLCFLWIPCSVIGLIMAIIAKAKKVPGGKTTAALVCGIVGTVLSLLVGVALLLVLHSLADLPPDFYEQLPYYEDYVYDMLKGVYPF